MKRTSTLDFTPLIDVILILLFAILLNIQTEKTNLMNTETQVLKNENQILQNELDLLKKQMGKPVLNAIEDQSKLDFIKNTILMVDVTLRSKHNQVWVDDTPTPIVLNTGTALSEEEKQKAKTSILDTLIKHIQTHANTGNTSEVIVISIGEDGSAYRFAYQLLESALYELPKSTSSKIYYRKMEIIP